MRRLRIALVLLALSAPVTAAAQDSRLTERLDTATAASVQQVVDSARRERLPTEPLVQKALEGSTLGASGERIVAAVDALHGQLGRARDALGGEASEAELTAAAGALRAGLPPTSLRRLQSLRSGRPLVVPIAVLTDLVAEGVPAEQATRRCSTSRGTADRTTSSSPCGGRCRRSGGAARPIPRPVPRSVPPPTRRWSDETVPRPRCSGSRSAVAAPAAAQLAGTLDMGAGTYRPDRAIPGGIASIVPALRYRSGPLELGAIGVYSDAPAGRWNFEGGTAATLRTPRIRHAPARGEGQAEWTSHYRVRGTTTFSGGVRAYLTPGAGTRAWVGRYTGRPRRSAPGGRCSEARSAARPSLGRSISSFRVANTTVDRSLHVRGVGPSRRGHACRAVRCAGGPSAGGAGRAHRRGAYRGGGGSARSISTRRSAAGSAESRRRRRIWGLSASRDIAPSLALVAAAGRAGSDPVTSVPGARYFALGLRLKVGAQPVGADAAGTEGPDAAAPVPHRTGSRGRPRDRDPGGRETPRSSWPATSPTGSRSRSSAGATTAGGHRLRSRPASTAWRCGSTAAHGRHPPGTRPIASEFGGEVAEVVVE